MNRKPSVAETSCSDTKVSFFKLSADMAKSLRGLKLTAAEWRLWSYLVTLDPFGDRYVQLPDILTIMSKCGMSKATAYRAIAKFQEAELFDFEAQIRFRNLRAETGVSKMRPETQKCETEVKSETDNSEMRQSEAETQSQQEFQNSQTIQTSTESSDSVEEDLMTPKEEQVLEALAQESVMQEKEEGVSVECAQVTDELEFPTSGETSSTETEELLEQINQKVKGYGCRVSDQQRLTLMELTPAQLNKVSQTFNSLITKRTSKTKTEIFATAIRVGLRSSLM